MKGVLGAFIALMLCASSAFAAGEAIPDPDLTPGEVNPDVTQDNIHTTICAPHWTDTVRPPVPYTNDLKRQGIEAYGYADKKLEDYEEDHRIPLEVGGHPRDPRNLWPEPYYGDWNARVKDKLETFIKRQVCAGTMSLEEGQNVFRVDWIDSFRRYCGDKPTAHCTGHPN